jgi:hypothetical protein
MLWTAPPPGGECQRCGRWLRLPRFGGATHANGFDNWSRHRQVALLSPLQDDKIWRVKIVWPNGAVHHFGKFTSERDATDWINAYPNLTKPGDTIDEPPIDLSF